MARPLPHRVMRDDVYGYSSKCGVGVIFGFVCDERCLLFFVGRMRRGLVQILSAFVRSVRYF